MYPIDVEKNEIVELPPKRFGELNFTERGHLQEWIAKCWFQPRIDANGRESFLDEPVRSLHS